ncbi:DEKNAAC105676 [Brettanomyces naardenensis]|uniref:DEKNAAC105676 n=1 Tax=Brettanomyces naardenensis TaxID=13370 RepID=A0A448YTZ5_BRENA|nr:DEKNAAC105676 [Brettanomyces naardenensis]
MAKRLSPRLESLWLDEDERVKQRSKQRAKKKLFSSKPKHRASSLLHLFDLADESEKKPKSFEKLISTPFGFDHVAHIDSDSSFGLENSFNTIDMSILPQVIKDSAEHEKDMKSCPNDDASIKPLTPLAPSKKVLKCQKSQVPFEVYSSFRTTPTSSDNTESPTSSTPLKHSSTRSTASTMSVNTIVRSDSVFTKSTTHTSASTLTSAHSSPAQSLSSKKRLSGFKSIYDGDLMFMPPVDLLPPIPQEEEVRLMNTSVRSESSCHTQYSTMSHISNLSHDSATTVGSNQSFSFPRDGDKLRKIPLQVTVLQGPFTERAEKAERATVSGYTVPPPSSPLSSEFKPAVLLTDTLESDADSEIEDDGIKLEKFELTSIAQNMSFNKSATLLIADPNETKKDRIQRQNAREFRVKSMSSEIVQTPLLVHEPTLPAITTPSSADDEIRRMSVVHDFFGDLGIDSSSFGSEEEMSQAFTSLAIQSDAFDDTTGADDSEEEIRDSARMTLLSFKAAHASRRSRMSFDFDSLARQRGEIQGRSRES